MKKHLFTAFMFAVIAFFVSCGGSSSDSSSVSDFGKLGGECYPNKTCDKGLLCDTENNVCVEDPENPIHDSDKTDSDSDGKTDTGSDSDSDSGDSQPDGSNTPSDDSDSVPDSEEPEPINENPSNLPECSTTSAMPCIDSQALNSDSENTNLIWSEKAPYRMRWIDAMDYCNNLNEGGFSDWLVPTIAALQTLHSTFCDLGGSCSKFGDIAFFWAAGQGYGVDFYNGGKAASKNVDENFDVRCVRKEITTRQAKCTGLPENAEWNTISQITQTWDWIQVLWTPSSTALIHSEEPEAPNSNKCFYKCKENYFWGGYSEKCKAPLFGNICTGQQEKYESGDDGHLAHLGECTPQSFTLLSVIESEKVVLDNNTGLMWQQTISTEAYTWEDAGSYCSNLTYGGYSDWRLPTPFELLSIVDNGQSSPAIDSTYFPDTANNFWSSSTRSDTTDRAWVVDFFYGAVYSYSKTDYSSVRCVRGESLPNSTFNSSTVNGDVIVTDTKTGLIWQKTYETDKKTWQEAINYCGSLTYADSSRWRLPNKNELASLVNYEKYNPASDFPDMPSDRFWSSSTRSDTTDRAWFVDFYYGYVNGSRKTYSDGYVRCVR